MSSPRRSRVGSLFSSDTRPVQIGVQGSHSTGATDEAVAAAGDRPHTARSRRDSLSTTYFSASPVINPKTPGRSFYHRSFHGSLGEVDLMLTCSHANMLRDPVHYSSGSLRQDTAELASRALSNITPVDEQSPAQGLSQTRTQHSDSYFPQDLGRTESHNDGKLSPVGEADGEDPGTPSLPNIPTASALTEMIRNSPPDSPGEEYTAAMKDIPSETTSLRSRAPSITLTEAGVESEERITEQTSLLQKTPSKDRPKDYGSALDSDLEGQDKVYKSVRGNLAQTFRRGLRRSRRVAFVIVHPKAWDRKEIWKHGVREPVGVLPAVFLGLLLNILDALSYGMILFPLGQPIFADLGSDGISIFYVSTIVSQLVFSCGGSIFRGGIGSEMIEVCYHIVTPDGKN